MRPLAPARGSSRLDWFIIGLLTTAGAFIGIEKLAPLRRSQPVLRDKWLLDIKHFFLFHMLIDFFLFATNYFVHEWFGWAVLPGAGAFIKSLPAPVQFQLILLAVDFALLDHFFGTFHLPKSWPEAYGVVGEAPPPSLLRQQLYPFFRR